jgi:hypothetical protein
MVPHHYCENGMEITENGIETGRIKKNPSVY